MIEKGYIELTLDKYTYKVRIPRFNKIKNDSLAISTNDLAVAEVCALPGCLPYYYTGEIVWVEFYNDLFTSPVIIGRLFSGGESKGSKLYLDNNSNIDMSIYEYINKIEFLEKKILHLESKLLEADTKILELDKRVTELEKKN